MDKRELYDSFGQMETETQAMLTKISELKESMTAVLEENAELVIENEHLRSRLAESASKANSKKKSNVAELSKSRQNLEKLYDEGFHVCNNFYGKRREDDESCVFCLDVIYGERKQHA